VIRCKANYLSYLDNVTNSVIFNCDITNIAFGSGTNNATSNYVNAQAIVLGTNNSLAKFASLGSVGTIGYSESLNNLPAASFGNFRPQAGSVLIGAGVKIAGIDKDLDGNLRADPPCIGAYEYVGA